MKKLKIDLRQAAMQGLTAEKLTEALPYISAIVKQVMGVANNVAQVAMFNARDDLRQHPQYRQRVKQAFKAAFRAWDEYEKKLINPAGLRYFHVEDMPTEIRKRYGEITDREYYEYWQNVGWSVYSKYCNFVSMLDNKFRLSLQKHGVPHAEILCRAMTTEQLLWIALQRYKDACKVVHKETALPYSALDYLFGCFSLKAVHQRRAKAMTMLIPNFPLEEIEVKNLRMSVEQLYEVIADVPEMYEGVKKSTEDYQELFRTKGEWKKQLRLIGEEISVIHNS